jgi:hypothetical protein
MEWISVEISVPIEYQNVLCFGSSGMFIGGFDTHFKQWRSDKMEHIVCLEDYKPVTYWMPLPYPPENQ